MSFVAVSDTIGRVRLRLTELLVRDLIMPFWALLLQKILWLVSGYESIKPARKKIAH